MKGSLHDVMSYIDKGAGCIEFKNRIISRAWANKFKVKSYSLTSPFQRWDKINEWLWNGDGHENSYNIFVTSGINKLRFFLFRQWWDSQRYPATGVRKWNSQRIRIKYRDGTSLNPSKGMKLILSSKMVKTMINDDQKLKMSGSNDMWMACLLHS